MTHRSVASRFLGVAVLVAGCASAGTSAPPTVSPTASAIVASPSPVATPSPIPSQVPTAAPLVGMAWQRIADPDLDSGARNASMYGVLAGGPGALAWGYIFATGPHVWWSADGRDWQAASIPSIADALVEEGYNGEVLDVVAGGPGFVAVGSYLRKGDTYTAVVWTSVDGKAWQRIPDSPVFEHSFMERVVVFRGELLAFGCSLATPIDCGAPLAWSSRDGLSWTRITPSLPTGLGSLDVNAAAPDRLWGSAHVEYGDLDQPTILTSVDGRAWTASPLRWLAPMTVHALPDGVYALVPPMPTAADGYNMQSWQSKTPGIFRSADLREWSQIASPQGANPQELIADRGTLVLTGAAGKACWMPSNCRVAAWRSSDGGTTWASAAVAKSDGSPEGTGGTINAVAALGDGTFVGVGRTVTANGWPSLAAWLSVPTAP